MIAATSAASTGDPLSSASTPRYAGTSSSTPRARTGGMVLASARRAPKSPECSAAA